MGVGLPVGIDDAEIAARVAASDNSFPAADIYRTGTGNGRQPALGGAFIFTTGTTLAYGGPSLDDATGLITLTEGTWWCQSVMRGGAFNPTTGFSIWQWRNNTDGVNYGNQAIHYSNANTNSFTHQPVMTGVLIVPAGETRVVSISFVGKSFGSFNISEARSYVTCMRIR